MVILAAVACILVLTVAAGELVRRQCARWMAAPVRVNPQPAAAPVSRS